jgi:hypothetical protein
MGVSARYAVRVAGLAVALGLSTLTSQAVALADAVGNDRIAGDASRSGGTGSIVSGMGGIAGSSSDTAAKQAEADEIRDMTHLVQSAQNSDEYQEQMFDLIADMRSQMAEISANGPTERLAPRGE